MLLFGSFLWPLLTHCKQPWLPSRSILTFLAWTAPGTRWLPTETVIDELRCYLFYFYFYVLYIQSFDQKKNGRFRLDDFISLCIFVQSARYVNLDSRRVTGWQKRRFLFSLIFIYFFYILLILYRNLFNSFDTSKQGRVTLDLNQFVYCSEYFLNAYSCPAIMFSILIKSCYLKSEYCVCYIMSIFAFFMLADAWLWQPFVSRMKETC